MQDNFTIKGKHLTLIERRLIACWHNKSGLSNREIAKRLGRAPQTIHNEIKRGSFLLKHKTKYSAKKAQALYERKHQNSGRRSKVTQALDLFISGQVRKKYSLAVTQRYLEGKVCLRTLYNWIEKGLLEVRYHDLLYPQYKKAKRLRKIPPKRPFGLSIEERPKVVNERSEFGHYEIDTVLLTKAKGECLLTLTERKTRFNLIRLIPDKSAASVNHVLKELQKRIHFKSLTSDNGREFARLSEVVKAPIYYCHAYASYERASNENQNRMIRRFLPKGTRSVTAEQVEKIENWINHYPRKMFHYRSSFQMIMTG